MSFHTFFCIFFLFQTYSTIIKLNDKENFTLTTIGYFGISNKRKQNSIQMGIYIYRHLTQYGSGLFYR